MSDTAPPSRLQLWNPFRRNRGRPPEDHRQQTRCKAFWFWPLTAQTDRRRMRWSHLRDRLRGLEVKSAAASDWPWPDFTPFEMACRHCGERYHWPDFMDALQRARDRIGRPFRILSAHRCSLHNARVGGAPRSQHLRLAADIALTGHDPHRLRAELSDAGFTGFGLYRTFIHADFGPKRSWYGSLGARKVWQKPTAGASV